MHRVVVMIKWQNTIRNYSVNYMIQNCFIPVGSASKGAKARVAGSSGGNKDLGVQMDL